MRTIHLYGTVGAEITEEFIRRELKAARNGPIQLRLNSGGGDVFVGNTIASLLEGTGPVARNRNLDIAVFGGNGLFRCAVAAVAAAATGNVRFSYPDDPSARRQAPFQSSVSSAP